MSAAQSARDAAPLVGGGIPPYAPTVPLPGRCRRCGAPARRADIDGVRVWLHVSTRDAYGKTVHTAEV